MDRAGPGSLACDGEWRAALTKAIGDCGKGRAQIAAEMEELVGSDPDYPISRALLDAWTAPSRTGHRFPVIYLPALIHATGAVWLLDLIARKCGRTVVTGEQAIAAELGMLEAEEAHIRERRRQLRRLIGGKARP